MKTEAHYADLQQQANRIKHDLIAFLIEAKREGNGPRRNLLFLNVSGEEKGLLGSAWYVENPAFPIENTMNRRIHNNCCCQLVVARRAARKAILIQDGIGVKLAS